MAPPNVPGLQSGGDDPQQTPAPDDQAPDNDNDAPQDADADADNDNDATATPEQEKQLVEFISQCRLVLYDRKNPKIIMNVMQILKSGNPVHALAQCAVMIVTRVEAAANQSGDKLDPAVLLYGGYEVVEDIADFSSQCSQSQKTPRFTEDQVGQAYLVAVDMYRAHAQSQGKVSQQVAAQDMQTMKQADQSGDLDDVLPGASQAAGMLKSDAAPAAAGGQQGQGPAPKGTQPKQGAAPPPLQKRRKRRRR